MHYLFYFGIGMILGTSFISLFLYTAPYQEWLKPVVKTLTIVSVVVFMIGLMLSLI